MVRRHADIAGYSIMLLDLTEVPVLDFTSASAIEDIIVDTNDSGREIFLVGARKSVYEMLEKQRVTRHFNTGHLYHKRIDALLHAKKLLADM